MRQSNPTPATMLVVDDQPNIRRMLEALFTREGFTVLTAENGKRALELAATHPIDVLISDLIMPDFTGVEVLQKVKQLHPDCCAIIVTAYGTIKSAVEATHCGAYDYLQKPFDMDEIKRVVKKGLEQRQAAQATPKPALASTRHATPRPCMVGSSPKMQEVYQLIERAARSRATVLIRGESGTGKELVARELHNRSPRSDKAFIAVSCAALPETLLESELFGHEKNAFTGAVSARQGRFELANQGTLFLDEIGDIPPPVQIKLLRVLQEWEFERVGGTKPIKVDVRLIAATNKDLEKAVADEKFRQDLYYRLNIIAITLPPLRERIEDIPLLVEHFLQKYNAQNARHIATVHEETLRLLQAYPWPGNVRELENAIERGVVLSDPGTTVLTPDLLPDPVRNAS
ncbi:MAG: sigma-54 dependent transcriptional regulator [Chloroherpetonaceae bacterium]|nr:sigma-54 dependent transcriptional regulator [Chthonomonadaceae bacterium]MDW8208316.1 sigma-54 dependent transcriptional regulator [Chloroherpetonaceae bacterium]